MRKDEQGQECPGTLGEYRDQCAALAGEDNAAVELLDQRIEKDGRDMAVLAPDSQMRQLLMPKLVEPPRGASAR